jgi:arsenate reductase-like glutaredoxin family protein
MAALENVPAVDKPLQTESGPAKLQKTDIFRKLMWFSYNNDNNWHSTTCERVKEIQEMNEKGIIPFDLHNNKAKGIDEEALKSSLELERLDKKFSIKKKKKKRNKSFPAQNETDRQGPNKEEIKTKQSDGIQNEADAERSRNRNNRRGKRNFNDKNRAGTPEKADDLKLTKRENPDQAKGISENRSKSKGKRRFPPRNRGDQNKGD